MATHIMKTSEIIKWALLHWLWNHFACLLKTFDKYICFKIKLLLQPNEDDIHVEWFINSISPSGQAALCAVPAGKQNIIVLKLSDMQIKSTLNSITNNTTSNYYL